jgi:hypothetical protein
MYARFVAVSVALLSGWMFVINVFDRGWKIWVLVWILVSGLVGAVGGVLYLLTFDGPERFHSKRHRFWGWGAMLVAVLLPTSLTFMLVPLVLLLLPSVFAITSRADEKPEDAVTAG